MRLLSLNSSESSSKAYPFPISVNSALYSPVVLLSNLSSNFEPQSLNLSLGIFWHSWVPFDTPGVNFERKWSIFKEWLQVQNFTVYFQWLLQYLYSKCDLVHFALLGFWSLLAYASYVLVRDHAKDNINREMTSRQRKVKFKSAGYNRASFYDQRLRRLKIFKTKFMLSVKSNN